MADHLRVGLALLPTRRWADARAEWAGLEAAGFDHGWTYDHLSWDPVAGGPWFSAIPTLAAAATATASARLGALVFSPNRHHPVGLAQDLATLADLAGGRLVAGVGAGGIGSDARMLGQPALTPPERVARLAEFLTILCAVLDRGQAEHRGRFFDAIGARCRPCRADGLTVPLAIAGNGPRTLELAARFGQAWVTDGAVAGAGPDSDTQTFRGGVARLADRLPAVCERAGRAPGELDRIMLVAAGPEQPFERPGALLETCAAYAGMGFTDVVVHAPRSSSPFAVPEDAFAAAVADELAEARALVPAG